jgi:mono/diheme cytochrome c family protein
VDDTNPNILRRLETRLLVRDTNAAVYGITYKWRPDYTDADIVTNALTEDIVVNTGSGTRTQQWLYPGPLDCLRCHTPAANYVLGPKTRQLNGNLTYAGSGVTDNQLRAWNHIGLFDATLDESNLANYDKLVSVTNTTAPIGARVRSYLDANCSQCHRPGGVPAFWDARYDTPLPSQGIINGTVANTLGLSGAKVVVPQDLSKSIMYLRVNTVDTFKMPPLARNRIDTNAVAALAQWINSFSGPVISAIADVTVTTNGSTGPIAFTIGDAATPAGALVLSATSSNPTLVGATNIVFGGSGSNRTVTVMPAANQGGTTTITINVDNGQVVASESFDVTVVGTMLAYYKFEGDALDSSGQGNHGTINGGAAFVPGKIGAQALNTDGLSGYVQTPFSVLNDFTIALWVKTTATGGAGQWWGGKGLVDGEVNGSADDFGTALVNNYFAFGMGNPDTTILSTTAINDGYWHHVAATRNSADGQMKIYVDGALQATGTGPTAPRTAPPSLRIGSLQTGTAAGLLAGTFDEVRLYNYVLNATQIGALANTPPSLAAIPNRVILAGTSLLITNTAIDAEAPPQVLSYSLVGPVPPPAGANINASNGFFAWRPAMAQAGTTNLLTIQVSDNGIPSLSATQSFFVTVNRPVRPGLTSASITNGQFKLLISGDAGPDYTVQVSTNLLDWTALWTTNPPALPFQISDPGASNYPQRFYRVLLGP